MNIEEFGELIRYELRKLGYVFNEEEDLVEDILMELHDAIIGEYPYAVFTLSKEFDTVIGFYFKKSPNDPEYERHKMCLTVGISKRSCLRKVPRPNSKPENIKAIVGKITWMLRT